MKGSLKPILAVLLIVILGLILAIIETSGDVNKIDQLYNPALFAAIFSLSIFYPKTRKYLFMLSFSLMVIMLLYYLQQQIGIANWFGSLGFGFLVMIVISYFPELVRRGYINKL